MAFTFILVLVVGCGGASSADTADDAGLHNVTVSHPTAGCDVTIGTAPTSTNRSHVLLCSPLSFDTKPPSHGDHYAIWADFKAYDAPVPWATSYMPSSMAAS